MQFSIGFRWQNRTENHASVRIHRKRVARVMRLGIGITEIASSTHGQDAVIGVITGIKGDKMFGSKIPKLLWVYFQFIRESMIMSGYRETPQGQAEEWRVYSERRWGHLEK